MAGSEVEPPRVSETQGAVRYEAIERRILNLSRRKRAKVAMLMDREWEKSLPGASDSIPRSWHHLRGVAQGWTVDVHPSLIDSVLTRTEMLLTALERQGTSAEDVNEIPPMVPAAYSQFPVRIVG